MIGAARHFWAEESRPATSTAFSFFMTLLILLQKPALLSAGPFRNPTGHPFFRNIYGVISVFTIYPLEGNIIFRLEKVKLKNSGITCF